MHIHGSLPCWTRGAAAGWLLLAIAGCGADPSSTLDAAAAAPERESDVPDSSPDFPLSNRFDRADGVFTGTVLRTEVHKRDVGHAVPLPYTHVTFRVDRAFKGASAGDEVTLGFLGGPDGGGRVLKAAGVPEFQVGDTDLLFTLAGDLPCPLVDDDRGRIRLVADGARTDAGTPLSFDPLEEVERLGSDEGFSPDPDSTSPSNPSSNR